MIKYLVIFAAVLLFGVVIGFMIGVDQVAKRASDGVCIRADDGEAYLRISEAGQKKIMDPETKLLYIRVTDMSTRNKQTL